VGDRFEQRCVEAGLTQCVHHGAVRRHRERQRIGIGLAVAITDLDHLQMGVGDRHRIDDRHLPNAPALAAEPALSVQVGG
jgi:hypothetical protein